MDMRLEVTEYQEKCSPIVLKVTALFGMPKPKALQKSKGCTEQNMHAINAPHKVEKSRIGTKTFKNADRHPEEGKTTKSWSRARFPSLLSKNINNL